jgi:hypothetical protein
MSEEIEMPVQQVTMPVHQVSWERREVSVESNPESVVVPAEVLDRSGSQMAVAFRDEHDNVTTAVSDGQGGWSVGFVQWADGAQRYRTQITTFVKGLAYALMASGNLAKSEGHQNLGSALQTAGNVVNAVTSLSDVAHYGNSAYQSYQRHGLTPATSKDLSKAGGQLLGLGAGVAAALSQSESVQAAANFMTFAAIAATGQSKTEQEAEQAREDGRRLFVRQAGAHLENDGTHVGGTYPFGGGADTPYTTTPFTPGISQAAEFPFRRIRTVASNANSDNSVSSGRPYDSRPERGGRRAGPSR